MTEASESKISKAAASASAEEVLTNGQPEVVVSNFVVYPKGSERRDQLLPVSFLDDTDLEVVTNRLDGRGGRAAGIVCVFVEQDSTLHEVRMDAQDSADRVRVLTSAIEQLTLVRNQLARLHAA